MGKIMHIYVWLLYKGVHVIQDKRGIIYAANQGGILYYNGVYWEEVVVPYVIARSLAMDDTGTVYVGGNNEIGYLEGDSKGELQYVSLLNGQDERHPNFSLVMRMHPTAEGIYCRTSTFIFRLRPGAGHEKTWRPLAPDARFYGSFVCDGRFFVRHGGLGLMEMVDDSLTLVPGGEIFSETGDPGKRFFKRGAGFQHAGFIINMKRRSKMSADFFQHREKAVLELI